MKVFLGFVAMIR